MSEALGSFAAAKDAIAAHIVPGARRIVAICGAPGSGKSTFAEQLSEAIEGSAVLPMDGFHLDNDVLQERGRLHRKGAPDTFDTAGLLDVLMRVKARQPTAVPTFDRTNDCVVPQGAFIGAQEKLVLVEGNYLLLDQPGWAELAPIWDVTVALEVPEAELERRLIARWMHYGQSRADATARANENDLPNARVILQNSAPAMLRVRNW